MHTATIHFIGTYSPRPDIHIPGSPDRCVTRSVMEDEFGKLWVLERINANQVSRREAIARNLERLSAAGFTCLAPYARTADDQFIAHHEGHSYQMSPYLSGTLLPQPDYVDDSQRGESLGTLLLSLRKASIGLDLEEALPGLALPPYIAGLHRTISTQEPDLGVRLAPVRTALAPFMEAYQDVPTAFNHGDFHPLNVIWNNYEATALIDWEFSGYRPELFDAANLLGCVGIEDPQALTNGLTPAFLQALRQGGMANAENMTWLPALILAQRWAWLSEWLRKHDREMVTLELEYLNLLSSNLDALSRAWATL